MRGCRPSSRKKGFAECWSGIWLLYWNSAMAEVHPVVLALIDKDRQVLFQGFLVDTFRLSIRLWVVRCGC